MIELMLLTQGSSDGCGSNTSSPAENSCKQLFGGAARYCRPGICRCDPAISYPHPLGILCCKYTSIFLSLITFSFKKHSSKKNSIFY